MWPRRPGLLTRAPQICVQTHAHHYVLQSRAWPHRIAPIKKRGGIRFRLSAANALGVGHAARHGVTDPPKTTAGMDRHPRVADRASNTTDSLVRRSDRPPFGSRDSSQRNRLLLEIEAASLATRLCDAMRHRDGWRTPGAMPIPVGFSAIELQCKSPKNCLCGQ